MDKVRGALQGSKNVIRFNWHFYVFAGACACLLLLIREQVDPVVRSVVDIVLILTIAPTFTSMAVSLYVYDLSDLYTLKWLDRITLEKVDTIVSITAGFDEFSTLLKERFSSSTFVHLDIYDVERHTELSIRRARAAYPLPSDVRHVASTSLQLPDASMDVAFLLLSAHEIRNTEERHALFRELDRVLSPKGRVIVVEHLRDLANGLAYSIGALHFHSERTWTRSFDAASLCVEQELKITPFITTFVLRHNGTTS